MIIVFIAIRGIRITVLTLAIRFTDLALMLVPSYAPPKPGSDACVRPQPIRARKRSSERIETALRRRTITYTSFPRPKSNILRYVLGCSFCSFAWVVDGEVSREGISFLSVCEEEKLGRVWVSGS